MTLSFSLIKPPTSTYTLAHKRAGINSFFKRKSHKTMNPAPRFSNEGRGSSTKAKSPTNNQAIRGGNDMVRQEGFEPTTS